MIFWICQRITHLQCGVLWFSNEVRMSVNYINENLNLLFGDLFKRLGYEYQDYVLLKRLAISRRSLSDQWRVELRSIGDQLASVSGGYAMVTSTTVWRRVSQRLANALWPKTVQGLSVTIIIFEDMPISPGPRPLKTFIRSIRCFNCFNCSKQTLLSIESSMPPANNLYFATCLRPVCDLPGQTLSLTTVLELRICPLIPTSLLLRRYMSYLPDK